MSRIYQTPTKCGTRLDLRYSFRKEFCGRAGLAYVVRCCGDYVGAGDSEDEARLIASAHQAGRQG